MGAIYGIVGEAPDSLFAAMGRRLAHRGPEILEASPAPGVQLGQRFSARRRVRASLGVPCVVDGVVENLAEIARELGWATEAARPELQNAAIFDLIRRSGPEAIARLEGAFSLALWDESSESLLLARDCFGLRSLHYALARGHFLFASEYKALLADPDLPAEPNRDVLQVIQCSKTAVGDASCLVHVTPVPPGHWVRWSPEGITCNRHWTPTLLTRAHDEVALARRFRDKLCDRLRQQTVPYERIGVALSGGLDASCVVAGLRQVAPEREIDTFCAGFGPEDPEMVQSEETARYFHTRHHPVLIPASEIPGMLPEMCWHLEDPVGREDILCMYACARAAADHVDLLLGGHMADVLLGGMPRHLLVPLAQRLPWLRKSFEDVYRYARLGASPRTLLGTAALRRSYPDGLCSPPRVLGARLPGGSDALDVSEPEPLNRLLVRAVLAHPGKGNYDGVQAAFGLDWNAPFASWDVAAFAFEIPDRLKIRGRVQKYILRRAMEGVLPPAIRSLRKSLARLQHDRALGDVVEDLASRLLSAVAVRERGLFDVSEIDALRRRPVGRPYPKERLYRLWTLLLTEVWCRLFLDHRGEAPKNPLF